MPAIKKKPRGAMSLTATLATAFLTLSAAALVLSSGLQVFSNIQAQQEAIASQQHRIAQEATRTVSSFIQEKFSVLETVVWLSNPATAAPAVQKQTLESSLGLQPAFRQLVVLDAHDRVLVATSRLSQVVSGQLAERLGSQAIVQLKRGQRYIGPVYIDPVTSEPLVVIAVPAPNVFGEYQGILAAEVNLKFIWDLVDRLQVGETGLAYVVDSQGNLIAFKDTARVLQGENVEYLREVDEFVNDPAADDEWAVDISIGIEGENVVSTYVPLGTPDWAVVIESPWEEVYGGVIRDVAVSIGITLTMTVLAGLVGVYLARRLAVPLVNLTDTATRITGGELGLQVAIGGPREAARLATAFNSMTTQLRQTLEGLEQRVAERTQALAAEVAERKQVAYALRASEERLALAVQGSNYGVWDWNIADDTLYWAPRLKEMLGYADDELETDFEKFTALLHPNDRAIAYAALEAHLTERAPFDIEERLLTKLGEYRWFYIRAQAVWDETGRPVRLTGFATDITERKQAEERLAAVHALGQKLVLFQNVTDIARLVVDSVRQVLHLPTCSLWLADKAQTTLVCWAYMPEAQVHCDLPLDTEHGIIAAVTRTGEPSYLPDVSQDSRYVDSGTQARSELCVPLKVSGRVIGALNVENDRLAAFSSADRQLLEMLTSATAIAIENARLYEEVRQELADRVRAEEALALKAQELARSNTELEQFAYTASHDLREPLRKIHAFGDRLKTKYYAELGEQGQDYLARMQSAADRMQTLIDDLLTYSRITTKAQPFVPTDLNQVARDVLADLETRTEQVGGRVELSPLPTLEVDPTQMRQLLQNLIGNALKFHRPDEPPLVKVYGRYLNGQTDPAAANGNGQGVYQLSVEDNGIGFDEKYCERIFQVFQRLHSRAEYEGSGIGLATCRKIVERHGGSITAASILGQGATFNVTLPLSQARRETHS
ncbi:MAG TPA: cache domain-containing protein [Anaerolineae bacterium]|nr:cache domain-containing protein [Anaerolineae bacterium]